MYEYENTDTDADSLPNITDEMFEPIYPGATLTVCGAYCAIMHFKSTCRVPFTVVANLLQLHSKKKGGTVPLFHQSRSSHQDFQVGQSHQQHLRRDRPTFSLAHQNFKWASHTNVYWDHVIHVLQQAQQLHASLGTTDSSMK